jgi:hypothetical protein
MGAHTRRESGDEEDAEGGVSMNGRVCRVEKEGREEKGRKI